MPSAEWALNRLGHGATVWGVLQLLTNLCSQMTQKIKLSLFKANTQVIFHMRTPQLLSKPVPITSNKVVKSRTSDVNADKHLRKDGRAHIAASKLSSQAIQVVEESKRFQILHQRDFEGRVNRGNVRTDQVLTCLEERLMGEIRKSFAVWRCEFLCW